MNNIDTICAIATAPGRGGVGIVRVSGPLAKTIGELCVQQSLTPRYAHFCDFHSNESVIDQGIALYFKAPHSFTGEEVFEFQGHGGPVILDLIVNRCLELGTRLARPGEFSERAFLNDKMDLTQAEAIADLIDANSKSAALQALNSLRGAFANEINILLEALTHLRLYVESSIDFPEEEIDFLNDGIVEKKLDALLEQTQRVFKQAQQGSIMREGMHVALAGEPNAGKSTLLNALSEKDAAIVTEIAGTTRDTLTEHIHINGMPLHITDTAGIRETDNTVEKIGIERAWKAIESANRILLLIDARAFDSMQIKTQWKEFFEHDTRFKKLTLIVNKIDLCDEGLLTHMQSTLPLPIIALSAKEGTGIEKLKSHLLDTMGVDNLSEGSFSARRRHLDALQRALQHLNEGHSQLTGASAGELLAEDLRLAQEALGEITGKLSADELLGKIFSSFCIGK